MVCSEWIDSATFLNDYWQKKPLVIRQAWPNGDNPLTADELAGLALEDAVESRMVLETPNNAPFWQLRRGPFTEADFTTLPKTHWTLLVSGVDHWVPEVADLLNRFSFIPSWRIDDVMVSYAVTSGSVGPHYDNYDVFLYQAAGQRRWSLTTQNCSPNNYKPDIELRIMDEFEVEEEYVLSPGDILYLPAHVGHHGVSLSDDCMTYSFGYRSYQAQELWESFGDYTSEHLSTTPLYSDPNWASLKETSLIPKEAYQNAKTLMYDYLASETHLSSWFGCFVTQLDIETEQHLPEPLAEDEWGDLSLFIQVLTEGNGLWRDGTCRMAYYDEKNAQGVVPFFINGGNWSRQGLSRAFVATVANHRRLDSHQINSLLDSEEQRVFLYDLWKLQWLQIVEV